MKKNYYEARRLYIENVGKKLLDYQKKGYLILDKDGYVVKKIEQRGLDSNQFGLTIDCVVYYAYDPDHDNGYYTPLKKLKEMISKIKIINPKHIISL